MSFVTPGLKGLSVPGPGHWWAVVPVLLGSWRARGRLGAASIFRGAFSPGVRSPDKDQPWSSTHSPGVTRPPSPLSMGRMPRLPEALGSWQQC